MSDDPRPAGPGGLLDLPLVVLDEAIEAVPRLVARTRRQVDLARRLAGQLPCVGGLLAAPAVVPVPAHEVTPVDVLSVVAEGGGDVGGDEPEGADGPVRTVDAAPAPGTTVDDGDTGDVPSSDELPVPDYDALAASQVVPRLATLSPDELEAVRAYERAHRNRQTILSRVAQLLDA